MLQMTVLKLSPTPTPSTPAGLPNIGHWKNSCNRKEADMFKHLLGHRNYAGLVTSVSLPVRVSIPWSLFLPILFFFGRGIDTMFPPLSLSLPTAFPKLFTHTTRMGWSLYPSRSIMPETRRVTGKRPFQRRKTLPSKWGWLGDMPFSN